MAAVTVSCDHCDDPVYLNAMGWGRCRSCGYESLRALPVLRGGHMGESRDVGEGRRRSEATTTTADEIAGLVLVINK